MKKWSEISKEVYKELEKRCNRIVIVDKKGPTVCYDKSFDPDNHVLESTPTGLFVRNDYFCNHLGEDKKD